MKKMIYKSVETDKKPTFKLANISARTTVKRMLVYTIRVSTCILLFLQITASAQPRVLPKIATTSFKKDTFNIIKFGARADGKFLNSKAINDAIDACSKKGGGVVLVPPGFWLTGPVILKSNVNLHLAKNAWLQFSDNFDDYKLIQTNWEGRATYRNESPLSATNATNIAITGFGIIDGNGDAWRMVKKDKLTESEWKRLVASGGMLSEDKKTWYPSVKSYRGATAKEMPGVLKPGLDVASLDSVKDFLRPNLLVFTSCKKVLLEGVTFQNSPAWCLHPLMCEDLTVRNISVKNPWYAQNGDGIDVESCKNVLIENSVFDVGDDGICIKSGRDEEGRKRGMPTENVIVRNCTVYHAHGGFVIGSEMSGGARNLFVDNVSFIGTDIGLRFKTTRGRGGIVENIYINNVNMKDIVGEAILFDMYYAAKDPIPLAGEKREPPKVQFLPVNETTPQFQNFYINNVVCDGADKAIFIRGVPEMHVKNVVLQNMFMKAKQGIDAQEASGIQFKNIELNIQDKEQVVYILNSDNILFDNLRYNNGAGVLFKVQGDRTKGVRITNTNVIGGINKVQTEFGAGAGSVEW
jgi:polygalacturonase